MFAPADVKSIVSLRPTRRRPTAFIGKPRDIERQQRVGSG